MAGAASVAIAAFPWAGADGAVAQAAEVAGAVVVAVVLAAAEPLVIGRIS